jgi:hypothetical protein
VEPSAAARDLMCGHTGELSATHETNGQKRDDVYAKAVPVCVCVIVSVRVSFTWPASPRHPVAPRHQEHADGKEL